MPVLGTKPHLPAPRPGLVQRARLIDRLGANRTGAMTFLLDNLPPQITLAMSTRVDPPLALSRLRARGELVEVRATDLRFTSDEAKVFLNEATGLHLEPHLVTALETRTEGWATSSTR
jgi:ATP/maltotriose-dependent transcriptional regulator MalT